MKTKRRISRRARRAGLLLTWTLAASLGLAAGLFGWHPLVNRIAPEGTTALSIELSGSRRLAPEELARLSGVEAGTPLSDVDLEAVAERIRSHPWVAQARVTALPPGRLLIGVEERTARATTRRGGEAWYVDGSGAVFARAPHEAGLPEMRGAEELPLEEPVAALVEGIQILDALAREGLPAPRRLDVGADERGERPAFEWRRGDHAQRVIVGEGHLAAKVARLAELFRADLAASRGATSLDLRFEERVILRAPEPAEAAEAADEAEGADARQAWRGNARPGEASRRMMTGAATLRNQGVRIPRGEWTWPGKTI